MIKEDHLLACTTKMFEILVALLHQLGQTLTSRETTWIVRTAQVHLSFRTHILAAIRLFTCQRASQIRMLASLEARTWITANVRGNFRYRRRAPNWGRRILACRSPVSTGGGEVFYAPRRSNFCQQNPARKPQPKAGSKRIPLRELDECCESNVRRPPFTAVKAPRSVGTEGR